MRQCNNATQAVVPNHYGNPIDIHMLPCSQFTHHTRSGLRQAWSRVQQRRAALGLEQMPRPQRIKVVTPAPHIAALLTRPKRRRVVRPKLSRVVRARPQCRPCARRELATRGGRDRARGCKAWLVGLEHEREAARALGDGRCERNLGSRIKSWHVIGARRLVPGSRTALSPVFPPHRVAGCHPLDIAVHAHTRQGYDCRPVTTPRQAGKPPGEATTAAARTAALG